MPTIPYAGFIGPTNVAQAIRADDERTINWYLETTSPGAGKVPSWLVPTPGLDPFVVPSASPARDLFYQDGRAFAVIGAVFYEVFASQTVTSRGTVAVDGRPATISSNGTAGNQLFITSGGHGYIFTLTTNAFAEIADADFLTPSAMGCFVDGFFLNLHAESRQFQLSALEDGTSWDGLDVNEVSQSSDDLLAMVASHREVWLFGSQNTAVWTNIGDATNPFQPIPGYLIPVGIVGRFAWGVLDNTVYWIGSNQLGNATVYRANGQTPERVSTFAIENYLSSVPTIDDAIGWTYQDRGHAFLLFYISRLETTICYDASTGAWHERALWDPTGLVWTPHLGRCHTFAFGKHLVGDRASGAIYQMDPAFYADAQVRVGA